MKRILVLEDDENLRELLVDVLDSLDYEVNGAEAPEVATHLAEEIAFDLVISDIRMAGPTDGLGALEAIKTRRPQLSCIVMTGFADEAAPLRALQIKVDDYLYKPFNVADVTAAMDRVKKAGQQSSWYRRALGKVLGQPDPQQGLLELQAQREECLRTFFVAVRSGMLYAETALQAWDALEELELAYMQVVRAPAKLTAEVARSGRQRYQSWQERLTRAARSEAFVSAGARSPDKVERGSFKRFVERVKAGSISAEELAMATCLRRMSPEARASDEEYQRLWHRMWN